MKNKIRLTLFILFIGAIPMLGFSGGMAAECTSYFTWELIPGTDAKIKFHNESSGDFNTWMWDFGDGITTGNFHPEHEFTGYGTYVVCLTVSDGINCTDVFCDTIVITPQCEADFEFTYVPTTPIHIQFTDISLGNPNLWHWDFGDGNTSTEQNPVHPYPVAGTYEVCLIIIHDDQQNYCTDTICKEVYIPDTVACEAVYTYAINPDFPPEVSFFDQSIGNITNWEWDFGDGSTSFEPNPVHVFPGTGEYLVCLNVYNADSMANCFHFICETIEIPEDMNCIAEFSLMADSSSAVKNQFTFNDQSNGYPDHWFWEFGDGNISHEEDPIHVYDGPGLYEVTLNSWNSNFPSCNDTRVKLVQTPSYYKVGGQAFIGSVPINNPTHAGDTGIAIMYRQQANMGLVAVDTNLFTEYGYFWFNDMMELPYVIKIGLTEGSEHYEDVVPTYYPEMMIWQQAGSVMLDDDMFEVHTSLMEVTGVENGVGSIKGRIVDDLKRDRGQIVNFWKVPVILTDMSSQPLDWTRSNANGQFSFDNLAYGTYKVYADVTGLYSLPENVTLDESFPNADSIYIQMSPDPLIGIEEPEAATLDLLSLYPNPAKNNITLQIDAEHRFVVEMMVYNQLGQQMISERHLLYKGGNKLEINISSLPESIYFLRLQGSNGTPLMSTFIKVD